MALLARNNIQTTQSISQIVPISTIKEFEIPQKYLDDPNKPRSLVSWYYHCLGEVKKTTHIPFIAQMKPAKLLLQKYEFVDILFAIRRAVGGKYSPSLYWILKHPNSTLVGLEE